MFLRFLPAFPSHLGGPSCPLRSGPLRTLDMLRGILHYRHTIRVASEWRKVQERGGSETCLGLQLHVSHPADR